MSLNVEKGAPQQEREYAQPKKGQRAARLIGLVDLGVQPQPPYKGEEKKPCREFVPLYWLASDTYEDEEGNVRHMVRSPWPLKIYPGAQRGHYFDFCTGIDPAGEVLTDGAGDLSALLGKACLVNIVEDKRQKDGKEVVYYNIKGVTEAPEDYPIADLDVDTFSFDTDAPTKEGFDKLSERNQKLIQGSVGYAGSELQAVCEGDSAAAKAPVDVEDFEDSDIPFNGEGT